jgi:hypothetical protein
MQDKYPVVAALGAGLLTMQAWASPLLLEGSDPGLPSATATGIVTASLRPEGPPIPGNSWAQSWAAESPIAFDFFAVTITSGEFSNPGLSSFSEGGWSQSYRDQSGVILAAAGSAATAMPFTMHFANAIEVALTADFAFFSGADLVFTARWLWDGQVWTSGTSTWNPGRSDFETVPLPSAGLAALAGFFGVITLRRRHSR